MPRWTNPATGQTHELLPVHIDRADPIEGSLHLEDGTVLHIRLVPTVALRAEGAVDEFDRPVYLVNSSQLISVRKVAGQ